MRKIAANYIFLPGYPLVRNGYVVIDGQNVDRRGETREVLFVRFPVWNFMGE